MLRRGTTVFFWFFFGMLDGKKEAYHFRSTEKDILDIQKEFQLGDCQNKTDIIDCMKWCAMERRCAGGVYIHYSQACYMLATLRVYQTDVHLNQTSFVRVHDAEESCGIPFLNVAYRNGEPSLLEGEHLDV
ncbi:hypothetical protein QR680_007042 [Steinernema hermaphroditum]|uniref:Apple domain-containing protein n=1 Tax=Steinernema hermaphroditum TaxID=289476 RepID=A0AA39HYK5_9BILA|nr:hypothetical protein QR680_007042 [Steinernema hermaphroditum]